MTGGGGDDTLCNFNGCRFSRTVGAEQAETGSPVDGETDALQRSNTGIVLYQILYFEYGCHECVLNLK